MTADPSQALALRDIHLPPAPSLWPLAAGWWVLAVMCVLLLAWAGRALWKQRRLRRQRKGIFDVLSSLESELGTGSTGALASLSTLLRRLALTRFPREQVAVLSGIEWLRFLDRTGGKGRFANGPGRVLARGPYQRSLPEGLDTRGLVALAREWVTTNLRSTA